MKLTGRIIYNGEAAGKALVTSQPISFYGGVDPTSGVVVERGHELEGECVKGRVLVYPHGKGSTVGSYVLYRLRKGGVAPSAIVNERCEPITAVGAIISEIPCVDMIEITKIRRNDLLRVVGATVES